LNFNKYRDQGGYHWRQYVRGTKYRTHANFIKRWVKEKNILDVGAGDGVITYLLRAHGIECEPEAIAIAKAVGVDVVFGDAYNLSGSYDAVTMCDVLEHFEYPEKALQQVAKVAPVLYITTPERGMVRDPYHVREWTREELPLYMKENGWTLTGELIVNHETKSMYGRFVRDIPNAE
jgi:2-polyprenyl-3-methyl-5-hydroxy-6-metoxy-1,4-benzoquinol methylase